MCPGPNSNIITQNNIFNENNNSLAIDDDVTPPGNEDALPADSATKNNEQTPLVDSTSENDDDFEQSKRCLSDIITTLPVCCAIGTPISMTVTLIGGIIGLLAGVGTGIFLSGFLPTPCHDTTSSDTFTSSSASTSSDDSNGAARIVALSTCMGISVGCMLFGAVAGLASGCITTHVAWGCLMNLICTPCGFKIANKFEKNAAKNNPNSSYPLAKKCADEASDFFGSLRCCHDSGSDSD